MALPVSRLYSINDRMINEYGAVDRMRIGRGNLGTWRNPGPVPSNLGCCRGQQETNRLIYGTYPLE
jgi:hypothetical protein